MLGVHLRVFFAEIPVCYFAQGISRSHTCLETDTDGVVDCLPEVLKKELRLDREFLIKTEHCGLDWHEIFQYVGDICLLLLLVAITRIVTEPFGRI